jgi:hypothetical protein
LEKGWLEFEVCKVTATLKIKWHSAKHFYLCVSLQIGVFIAIPTIPFEHDIFMLSERIDVGY